MLNKSFTFRCYLELTILKLCIEAPPVIANYICCITYLILILKSSTENKCTLTDNTVMFPVANYI